MTDLQLLREIAKDEAAYDLRRPESLECFLRLSSYALVSSDGPRVYVTRLGRIALAATAGLRGDRCLDDHRLHAASLRTWKVYMRSLKRFGYGTTDAFLCGRP